MKRQKKRNIAVTQKQQRKIAVAEVDIPRFNHKNGKNIQENKHKSL